MKTTTRVWLLSTGERIGKSFLQGYVAAWLLVNGVTDPSAITDTGNAYETMFTMNNLKAGVVMSFLSLATSILSTPFGVDKNSPSLTVTETPPTLPPRG